MSNWIDDVAAVVWAGVGGDYINEALANVLTGKVNPSGKLTETFPPPALEDVPAYNTFSDETCIVYSEGLNVGYRYYNTFDVPVLFPFGFGFSHSKFNYYGLHVSGSNCDLTVSFTIENLSDCD